jgi:hypothetical protein
MGGGCWHGGWALGAGGYGHIINMFMMPVSPGRFARLPKNGGFALVPVGGRGFRDCPPEGAQAIT